MWSKKVKLYNSGVYGIRLKSSMQDKTRIKIIQKLVGKNKHILDVGCEDGEIAVIFRKNDNIVDGVEISAPAVERAKQRGVKVYEMDLENIDWDKKIKTKYDIVFAGEIIEHIYDTDQFLENIKNVLKTHGELIITTPNLASLGRRLLLLFGKNPLTEVALRKINAGHIRYFTFASLIELLHFHGFKILDEKSTKINFNINGQFSSEFLAKFFKTLGSTIIIRAKKI